jgi:hypothetical protein
VIALESLIHPRDKEKAQKVTPKFFGSSGLSKSPKTVVSTATASKKRKASGLGVQDGDGRNCHVAHKRNSNGGTQ